MTEDRITQKPVLQVESEVEARPFYPMECRELCIQTGLLRSGRRGFQERQASKGRGWGESLPRQEEHSH